jgi:hypothetical protein
MLLLLLLLLPFLLQYPDVNHGTVNGKPIREVLADSSEWLDGDFISVVQQRGAAIIKVFRAENYKYLLLGCVQVCVLVG